ncbi:hypothetical protein GCM10007390_20060 [Persicitalea jodogahamensis]|uniref:Thiamine phosphate synthase/TenI domain-containing protein n=2 Tax=Persicitalea jodogahamensis TaxID=402147 RepID=A0A8J3D877_9BACT|nr:hypothetical protein GCM10007390_20060 [Persicitalea jodogahamensis]
MEESVLLKKLELCLSEELAAVQIWDNFQPDQNIPDLIQKIGDRCHQKSVPVLINNRWELLNESMLDGVHFDQIPENYPHIIEKVKKPFINGLTCNNDLSYVHWATANRMDYISFCSIFPSTTSNSCELVDFSTVQAAAKISNLPIFLAGGIHPENVEKLNELDYSGIAVISGIMSSDQPNEAIKNYTKKLKINRK